MGAKNVYTRVLTAGIVSLRKAGENALKETAEALLSEINGANVVPHFTGNLQRSTELTKRGGAWLLIYDTKIGNPSGAGYAQAVYENKRGARFKYGRRERWADPWITGSKRKNLINAFKRGFKE